MKTKLLLFLASIMFTMSSCWLFPSNDNAPTPSQDTVAIDTTTYIRIVNNTNDSVTVWITLGATAGCLQHISQIPFITDSVSSLSGSFTLYTHDSTIDYAPPVGIGYNGQISINTQALNCPTQQFPEGTNIFEFITNISFQAGNPQETVEISCVAGVNCLFQGILTGGEAWNASSMYPEVDTIYNRGKYDNSGLIGVFPYGCDDCTSSVSPPACAKNDRDKQKYPICTVQRNAIGSGGGLVRIAYLGSAPQPAVK
jgi:hypothetical protein